MLVVEGQGTNNLVEKKHGKKYKYLTLPAAENASEDSDINFNSADGGSNPPPPPMDLTHKVDDDDDGDNVVLVACDI